MKRCDRKMVDAWNNHRCSFVSINSILQFVQIWGQVGQTFFQSLPLLTILDDCERFAGFFHGIALHHLPMVKHTLRESLASSIRPQVGGETWKNNQKHEKSWIPKKNFSIEKGANSDIQKPSMVEKPPVETANGLEDQDFIIESCCRK